MQRNECKQDCGSHLIIREKTYDQWSNCAFTNQVNQNLFGVCEPTEQFRLE